MGQSFSRASRADDERCLSLLRARAAGTPVKDVAQSYGLSPARVYAVTAAVMADDKAHDPDDFSRQGYWA